MTDERQKILTMDGAAAAARDAQAAGRTVVLCHGCFDIVHPGHIRHLQQAAKLGDHLLVTITGDPHVRKGADRPLIPQELRAENLAALDCVDWVAVSEDATAEALLARLRPNVYVKGREYEHNRDPRFEAEKRAVQAYGGRVVFTSGDVVFSSTAIIGRMQEAASPMHAALQRMVERLELTPERLEPLLQSFRNRRILVVGETVRDLYVHCDRPEVAGEAPVMTLRPLECHPFDGGAAAVATQLVAMGAQPTLLTAVPDSEEGEALRERLAGAGVSVESIASTERLPQVQRFIVGHARTMQVEQGEPLVLDADQQRAVVERVLRLGREHEACVLADQSGGLLSAPMLGQIGRQLADGSRVLVGLAPGRRSGLLAMRRMNLLCPSELDLRHALHNHDEGLSAVVWNLLHETQSRSAIVTLGAEGATLFEHGESLQMAREVEWSNRLHAEHVPALCEFVVDEAGGGESLVAAATLTLLSTGSTGLATLVGSVAWAAQARRLGRLCVGTAELRRGLSCVIDTRPAYQIQPKPAAVLTGP